VSTIAGIRLLGDAQKIRLELLALADVHREDPVRQASFFEENGDPVAVRCSPIIEVDDGPATFDKFSDLIEKFRFARDSPLEGPDSNMVPRNRYGTVRS
jgi:hypothetical protein